MLGYLFYLAVASTILLAMVNWRAALYVCLVLDVVRDPVRKLAEGQSVLITQSVNVVWVAIVAGVLLQERRRIGVLVWQHPQLRTAAILLCAALVPGAVVSSVSFEGGWRIAVLGAASYLAIVPGILIGYCLVRDERDVVSFFAVYSLANSAAFVGAILEYVKAAVPGLGGIGIHWIRNREGYFVDLICGFYRSPDLLGLHAATVCMFAVVVGLMRPRGARLGWFALVPWAAFAMFLSGRRKMLAMPFIFALGLVYFHIRSHKTSQAIKYGLVSLIGVVAVVVFSETLGLRGTYTDYAATTVTEGSDRFSVGILNSPLTSLSQNGILGGGLGTATQGSYQVTGQSLTWQEDGGGRLFVELGLPGVVLFFIAALLLIRRCRISLAMLPPGTPLFRLEVSLICILLANLASFIISHQAYSGDPSSICIVLICLGAALSLPSSTRTDMPLQPVGLAIREPTAQSRREGSATWWT